MSAVFLFSSQHLA